MHRLSSLLLVFILCVALGAGGAAAGSPVDPFTGLALGARRAAVPARQTAATPGVTWVKHADNPVLDAGAAESWDAIAVGLPSVLAVDDAYLMWYSGGNALNPSLHIGLAASADGLHWTKSPGNPVLTAGPPGSWDSGAVTAPHVIRRDGLYRMWYRGTNDPAGYQGAAIGYATSPDGFRWTRHGANPVLTVGATGVWDSDKLWSASVMAEAGGYKMWYSACYAGRCRIGYATSPDGVAWTKHAGNPVFDLGPAGAWDGATVYYPNVLRSGGAYHMWYSGFDGGKFRIGHAISPDGVAWTRDPDAPVVVPGPPGSWDSLAAFASPVIAHPGLTRMWYTGLDASGVFRVGAATAGQPSYLPLIRR